jgi:ubiquinone/menaquinone biosynthesis C-methylase UbiE
MSVAAFKTGAWASQDSADRYQIATAAAPEIFQVVRQDLYMRYVQRYAKPGARILDLGCGSGLVSIPLHDLGYEVVACDVSAGMLERLRIERGDRSFELRQGSAFEIPAEDGEFDMVISRMFIQHFPEWSDIVKEKARVTKPGGIVLFDFGNQEHVDACDPNLGKDDEFPYCPDPANPDRLYAFATSEQMASCASDCGLDVVQIAPHGLLLYNAFLWREIGPSGIAAFNDKLGQLLVEPKARELLILVEEQLLPLLPKTTASGNITVLRRQTNPPQDRTVAATLGQRFMAMFR